MPPPLAQSKNIRTAGTATAGTAKGYLLRRSDYLKTYKGWFVRKELFVLYARKNHLSGHRFGITAPKTFGSAVVRNRFKRWSKELYRKTQLGEISAAIDINIYMGNKRHKKEDFKNASYREFKSQFQESFEALISRFR